MNDSGKQGPGPKPRPVKLDDSWENAVKRALKAPPARNTRKQKPPKIVDDKDAK